jgi:predicted outer membrane repeat protein
VYANNTFINNYAEEWGGAIYFTSAYDSICPVFMNNIFWNNTAGNQDFDLHHNGAEELFMVNNDIDPTRISGSWAGYGNISADPEFQDDSCHIPSWSPCTDAGIDSVEHLGIVYYAPDTDFENEPRPNDSCTEKLIDIGADESVYCPHFTAIPDFDKNEKMLNLTVYPNPLTTNTTLSFRLCKPENVQFTVYNLQSQIVYSIEEWRERGEQQMQWNAEGLPAGIYYFRIQAGEAVGSGKMMLMKPS